MKIDSHYYATLAFARACGCSCECAHKLAYANQFVDDAKVNHLVIEGDTTGLQEIEQIDGKAALFNAATCHSYDKVNTFNYSAMINNTVAFHFVPGLKGQSFVRQLRCGENSPIIEAIVTEAIDEGDPIRLGMVLHAYMDTFAHQGFSGLLSKVNDVQDVGTSIFTLSFKLSRGFVNLLKFFNHRKFDEFANKIIPAYGHGQVWDYPDIPSLGWHYEYDYSDEFSQAYKMVEIDNPERYRRAFENLKLKIEQFLEKHPQHRDASVTFDEDDFKQLHKIIFDRAYTWWRIRSIRKLLVAKKLFSESDNALKYNDSNWLQAAFANYDEKAFSQRKVEPAMLTTDFASSDWYAYFRGVKWYKRRFHHYCQQHGLVIPQ